jgi:SAM-dependent methyltransferase
MLEEIYGLAEEIDFGETALDIGSRDGRYAPVIRELGPRALVAIDPSEDELQQGVDNGLLAPQEAFKGTLQEYVARQTTPADSLFIFTVSPYAIRKPSFSEALLRAVKPGGIVVASYLERSTAIRFSNMYWRHELEVIRAMPRFNDHSLDMVSHERTRDDGYGLHEAISIGRRAIKWDEI